jgi:type IV pilus assembly protein PilC
MADPIEKRFRDTRREIRSNGPVPQDRTFTLRHPIRRKEVAEFTRQLAAMVQAKLPLTRCLEILHDQQKNARFKKMIASVIENVKAGKSLSESLQPYPRQFGSFYVNMLHVGEAASRLTDSLLQIAAYLEKMAALRRKVWTALTYPLVVVTVAVGAVSFLVFGVMPVFSDMFHDFDASIPLPARMLIGFAQAVKTNLLWIVLATIVCLFLWWRFIRTANGLKFKDGLKFKIPFIGPVYRRIATARFTRTLGTMLESGVSLLDALDVTARSVENVVVESEIRQMKESASRGEAMETSLVGSRIFPPLVIQMIAVGEETAELPDMLKRTASFYEGEVDAALEAATSILEPMIIVILGVVVGGTMIAIYMQIFDLMNVIQ